MSYGMQGNKIPKGYSQYQMQQFTPEQLELFKNSFAHLGPDSFLSRLAGGDQSMFAEMEQPALRQFGEMQGGMASKFSGMGMGGRHSSGFQNTMNQATSDFAQGLQSKRMELQNQAIRDLMGMSNELMNQRPYERGLVEKNRPWWQDYLIGMGSGAASAATKGAMGGF